MSKIWNLTALCRCCHADGTFKSMDVSYCFMGEIEVYADMIRNTFGLYVNPPLIEASYSICDNCIQQLRNALQFKKQIEQCEIMFEDYCKNKLAQQSELKMEIGVKVVIKPECGLNLEEYHNPTDCIPMEYASSKESYNNNINEDQEINEELPDIKTDCKDYLKKPKSHYQAKMKSQPKLVKRFGRVKTEKCLLFCGICKDSFSNLEDLKMHKAKQHLSSFTCTICNKRFNREIFFKRHIIKHSQPSEHHCSICGRYYKRYRDMLFHRNTHTRETVFVCDICNKKFLYKCSLRKHIAWHNGTNKKFICDICGNSFNDRTNLNIHCRTVHDKLKLFKCNICSKMYAANKSLKIHYRSHTGERPYKCDICGKTFVCSSTLGNHRKVHMEKLGKYSCKVCGAIYDQRSCYSAHVRSHIGSKPHKCHICDKDFTCHYSLKRHIESHDGIKRFSCNICNKKFCGKSQLQRHLRNLHDPNKKKLKVKCDLCKMSVTDIEKHMKSHMNRVLQCDYCPKTYSERNTLNRHIKQRHSGLAYVCDICGKKYVKLDSLQRHTLKVHDVQIKYEDKSNQIKFEDSLERL